jgi:hypothetical protein
MSSLVQGCSSQKGRSSTQYDYAWINEAIGLAREYPNVYTDISCWNIAQNGPAFKEFLLDPAYNDVKRKILLHPGLPFGFVLEVPEFFSPYEQITDGKTAEGPSTLWTVSWEHDNHSCSPVLKDAKQLPLIPSGSERAFDISDIQCSPLGRWLIVEIDPPEFPVRHECYLFLLPLDSCFPDFVGDPVLLASPGLYDRLIHSTAWISGPLSFVVAGGDCLYRWELEGLHEKLVEDYRAGH